MTAAARPGRERRAAAAVRRLSLLLRSLARLAEDGTDTVSSQALAQRFCMNAAQIRKDLANLGDFGVRGVGYRVADLRTRLASILGLDRTRVVVVVGAGHLGQALADSGSFNGASFRVAALFDVDERKIGGRSRTGVPILSAEELTHTVAAYGAEIGVLAVPAEAAPGAAERLAAAGVKGILNFAPANVGPFAAATVKNVDLALCLESLAVRLAATG